MDEQDKWRHVWMQVEMYGRDRKRTIPQEWCPASFLAGAMSVFFALGEENHLPAHWVLPAVMGQGVAKVFEEDDVEDEPFYPAVDPNSH